MPSLRPTPPLRLLADALRLRAAASPPRLAQRRLTRLIRKATSQRATWAEVSDR